MELEHRTEWSDTRELLKLLPQEVFHAAWYFVFEAPFGVAHRNFDKLCNSKRWKSAKL